MYSIYTTLDKFNRQPGKTATGNVRLLTCEILTGVATDFRVPCISAANKQHSAYERDLDMT